MSPRAVLFSIVLAGLLPVAGCGDEAEGSSPPASRSVALEEEFPSDPEPAEDESIARTPPTARWEGVYDQRVVVLEAVPPARSDQNWDMRHGPDSQWEIERARLDSGTLTFDMRFGGRLTGKLVRFEGEFSPSQGDVRGSAFDGSRRSELTLRRTD